MRGPDTTASRRFWRKFKLAPMGLLHVYSGSGALENKESLITPNSAAEFTASAASEPVSPTMQPQIMLDFGREVNGRLELQSDSDQAADVNLQYGESEAEALNQPYLGTTPLHVPPGATVHGPKGAFRYALLRFERGTKIRFRLSGKPGARLVQRCNSMDHGADIGHPVPRRRIQRGRYPS